MVAQADSFQPIGPINFYYRFFQFQDKVLAGEHPKIKLRQRPDDLAVLQTPDLQSDQLPPPLVPVTKNAGGPANKPPSKDDDRQSRTDHTSYAGTGAATCPPEKQLGPPPQQKQAGQAVPPGPRVEGVPAISSGNTSKVQDAAPQLPTIHGTSSLATAVNAPPFIPQSLSNSNIASFAPIANHAQNENAPPSTSSLRPLPLNENANTTKSGPAPTQNLPHRKRWRSMSHSSDSQASFEPEPPADIKKMEVQKERKRIESYFMNTAAAAGLDRVDSNDPSSRALFNISDALSQALRKYKHVSGLVRYPEEPADEAEDFYEPQPHIGPRPAQIKPNPHKRIASLQGKDAPIDLTQAASSATESPYRQAPNIPTIQKYSPVEPLNSAVISNYDAYSPTHLFHSQASAQNQAVGQPSLIVRNTNVSPISPQPHSRHNILSMPDKAIARWSTEGITSDPSHPHPARMEEHGFAAVSNNSTWKPIRNEAPGRGRQIDMRAKHKPASPKIKQEYVSPPFPQSPAPQQSTRMRNFSQIDLEGSGSVPGQDDWPRSNEQRLDEAYGRVLQNRYDQTQTLEEGYSRDLQGLADGRRYLREHVERVSAIRSSRGEPHIVYEPTPRSTRPISVRPLQRVRHERSRSPRTVYRTRDSTAVYPVRRRAPSPLVLYDKYGNEYVADSEPYDEVEEYEHRPAVPSRLRNTAVYGPEAEGPYERELVHMPGRYEHSVYSPIPPRSLPVDDFYDDYADRRVSSLRRHPGRVSSGQLRIVPAGTGRRMVATPVGSERLPPLSARERLPRHASVRTGSYVVQSPAVANPREYFPTGGLAAPLERTHDRRLEMRYRRQGLGLEGSVAYPGSPDSADSRAPAGMWW